MSVFQSMRLINTQHFPFDSFEKGFINHQNLIGGDQHVKSVQIWDFAILKAQFQTQRSNFVSKLTTPTNCGSIKNVFFFVQRNRR